MQQDGSCTINACFDGQCAEFALLDASVSDWAQFSIVVEGFSDSNIDVGIWMTECTGYPFFDDFAFGLVD